MKFIELFAGIGGFRAGLEPLGHQCVGFVEWDKYARKSYEAIWPQAKEEWTAHDITTVTDDALREFTGSVGGIDLIAGGFPCQAFSVAGKRGGFEDTRGTLFFEVARFANVLRPKYLLLENVVGLLNHDDGRTFYTILNVLEELGYWYEWQVCNATDFGIPQNRERVFIVGHLGGTGGRKVFPILNHDTEVVEESEVYIIDDQGRLNKELSLMTVAPTLRAQSHGNEPKIIQRPRGKNHGGVHGLAPAVTGTFYEHNNHVVVIDDTQGFDGIRTYTNEFPTIRSQRNGLKVLDTRIRKLTPLETWRLMGRQDWEFDRARNAGVSDSQLYKQAGNSLVPQIVAEIGKRMTDG